MKHLLLSIFLTGFLLESPGQDFGDTTEKLDQYLA